MIPAEKVQELAEAHARLDDPTTAAIWIRQSDPAVWLVEVIPTMEDDDRVAEPTYFHPGIGFRFPLAIIAGNRQSLERAIERNRDLASAISRGQIVFEAGRDARDLVELARLCA